MTRQSQHKDHPEKQPGTPPVANARELQVDPSMDPYTEPVQQHLEKPRRRKTDKPGPKN